MTNLDSILKSRDITLSTKVHLAKAMVFPVVMYGCESWTIKKVECWRIDAFELWCRRRLLRVPWTARRSNQSILRRSVLGVHWKEWCWSWNSNTLATSFEELTHWKRPWCWEGLGEGGEGDNRGWDGWMASLTRWTWVWVNSRSWWWTGRPGVLRFMGSQRVGHDWATELNWTNMEIWCGQNPHHAVTFVLFFLHLSNHLHPFQLNHSKNSKKQLTQKGHWNMARHSSYSLLLVIKAGLCLIVQFQGLGKTLSERFQVMWNKHRFISHLTS